MELMKLEQSKIMDTIFLETGSTMGDITYHVEHFQLRGNQEVKEYGDALKREFEETKKQQMQRSMLSPAQAKELAEIANDLEKPTYN